LNSLRELLDIKKASDVALATPKGVAQPTNRSDSDLDDSDVLSMQSPAAGIGASTPVQTPIATPDENHAVGIQENDFVAPTLPEDTRASVQVEKPTASSLEEKSVAIGSEKSTKAARDENHAVGIQEDNLAVPTLPEDTRASVQEEKPTVSPLEEKPTVRPVEEKRGTIGSEKSTKAPPDKKSAAVKTPQRVKPRPQSPPRGVQHVGGRAQATPSKQNPPSPQYFFEPFGHQQTSQTSTVNTANQQTRQISAPNANNYFGNQRAGQPEMPLRNY
jgi:hypothetical protein